MYFADRLRHVEIKYHWYYAHSTAIIIQYFCNWFSSLRTPTNRTESDVIRSPSNPIEMRKKNVKYAHCKQFLCYVRACESHFITIVDVSLEFGKAWWAPRIARSFADALQISRGATRICMSSMNVPTTLVPKAPGVFYTAPVRPHRWHMIFKGYD